MNEKLLELLKNARINKGLKQQDAADALGLKGNTISNWEKGRSQPDIENFVKLCSMYGVGFSDLLNTAYGSPVEASETVSSKEQNHIKKYRALDERSQQTVDTVLNNLYEIAVSRKETTAKSQAASDSPSRAEMHRILDQELDAAERGQTSPVSTDTNGSKDKKMA